MRTTRRSRTTSGGSLKCEHGCTHERAWCETQGCTRCNINGRPCDVAAFVADNRADCERTFAARDTSFLTVFTSRAAAALVHLRQAWCNADPSNRPSVELAIQALMNARSLRQGTPLFHELLVHSLDEDRARRLLAATGLGGGRGALPAKLDEQVALTVTVSPTVAELLAVLDEGEGDDPLEPPVEAQAARVLHRLVDHAQQGVYRPGAWERGWLARAFGEGFLARLCPGDPYGRYPDCTLEDGCPCRGCAMFERPAWPGPA
jgi:hypothetical protein